VGNELDTIPHQIGLPHGLDGDEATVSVNLLSPRDASLGLLTLVLGDVDLRLSRDEGSHQSVQVPTL